MSTNLVIVGAGPAGEAAAKTARKIAEKSPVTVTLVERENPGGLCLNKGCIPSKTLLEAVHKRVQAGQKVDWAELQKIKSDVVTSIRTQLAGSLKREKINFVQGTAKFKDANTFEIQNGDGAQTLPFDKAILTTGTQIFYPPPLNQFKDDLLNSDKILDLKETPTSVVIVGGGAVGLEFACLLNAAGSKVTVVELQDAILPGEDPNIVSALTRSLEGQGINIVTGTKVDDLQKTGEGWKGKLSNDTEFEAQHVVACVGRFPDPETLALDKANIQFDKTKIELNDFLQTTNPNVFAAGDGTATTRLAHAAAAQSKIAAMNALGAKEKYDDRFVPRCLYSWPEVASVGTWKYQLDEKNEPVKASRAFYKGSAKALAAGETEGFVQIVSDPNTKKILGAQIIGAHATELIHIFSVALAANMTTTQLSEVMFAHPTLAELIKDAALK